LHFALLGLLVLGNACSTRTQLVLGDGGLLPLEDGYCELARTLAGLGGSFDSAPWVAGPRAEFCVGTEREVSGLYELSAYVAPSAGTLRVTGGGAALIGLTCGVPRACDDETWSSGRFDGSVHVVERSVSAGEILVIVTTAGRHTWSLVAAPGRLDCDGDPANGYEIDSDTDARNCGACGVDCGPLTGCSAGSCCESDRSSCDGDDANGCEANLASDGEHCGACGAACEAFTGCLSGSCCSVVGQADCDGVTATGCEITLLTDEANCGRCGVRCAAAETCMGGACGCEPGFDSCDGEDANGCEIELASSDMHCGRCGNACEAGTYCEAGACVPQACTPGEASCSGPLELRECTPRGDGFVTRACDAMQGCEAGACLPWVCTPGASRCTGATLEGREICAGNGLGWTAAPCATTETCAGTDPSAICTRRTCTPGTTRCLGASSVQTCAADGLSWGSGVACGAGASCDPSMNACRTWDCTPGSTTCASASTVRQCRTDGLGTTDISCLAGRSCSAGVCVPWICTPGSYSCTDLATRRLCNADGLGDSAAPCTGGAAFGYACLGAGMCAARGCIPGTPGPTCASVTARQVCDVDGQRYVAAACGASEVCSGGVCVGAVCTPGSAVCIGPATREVCNPDGLGTTEIGCGASSSCSAGACVPWVCTPGTFSCVDTNTRRVCNADGLGYSSASCTGSATFGYACTGAGICTDRVCSPGGATSVCASATARQVCNLDGLGVSASACASGQSCLTGTCAVRCGDAIVGTGETCDDGNTTSGDGCSSSCASERPCAYGQFNATGYMSAGGLSIADSAFTIEAWVRLAASRDFNPVISLGSSSASVVPAFGLNIEFGVLVAQVPAHNTLRSPGMAAAPPITPGRWHHIAYVYRGGGFATGANHRYYVNGVEYADVVFEGNASRSPFVAGAPTGIGMMQLGTGRFFSGQMAMVRVSNGVRYSGSFTPAVSLVADGTTRALWRMDEGGGTTAFDASSGARHATLLSGVTLQTGCLAP
jgi:hypothetical protein